MGTLIKYLDFEMFSFLKNKFSDDLLLEAFTANLKNLIEEENCDELESKFIRKLSNINELIKIAIKNSENNQYIKLNITLLGFASLLGKAQVVNFLLEKNADPCELDSEGCNPLERAAIAGDAATVNLLLQDPSVKENINKISKNGWSALHYALDAGQKNNAATLVLLETDAKDHVGKYGLTGWHYAAVTNNIKILEDLNDKTFINHLDHFGETPLITAINKAISDIEHETSESYKQPVNVRDVTAHEEKLNQIIKECHAVIKILIEMGADVNIPYRKEISEIFWKSKTRYSPLYLCNQNEQLRKSNIYKLLLDKGAVFTDKEKAEKEKNIQSQSSDRCFPFLSYLNKRKLPVTPQPPNINGFNRD